MHCRTGGRIFGRTFELFMIAVITGFIAGLVHVLTGPDHLAAIAPLAARQPVRAWIPGLRWGIGHSAGVAVVGVISLLLRDLIPVALISAWGERFVGVMLVGIGLWAWRRTTQHAIHTHEHEHNGDRHVHVHIHTQPKKHQEVSAHSHHAHAAFGIGTLHGLAGSSHFLGVLPALAFSSRWDAFGYLLAFAVGTVTAMAGFSWGMGVIARRYSVRSGRLYQRFAFGCAGAAMLVGAFWLVTSFH